RGRHDRRGGPPVAGAPGAAHPGPARPAAAPVGAGGGGAAGRPAASPAAGGRAAGPGGVGQQAHLRPPQPGDLRVRAGAAGRRGPAPRRLDDAPAAAGGLRGPLAHLPLPARQGQLDRGWHLGGVAQHHRRAGPGAAARTPHRHRRRLEGPAEMTDLLYGEVEEQLRTTVRRMLDDRSPVRQVLARCEDGQPADLDLWRVLATEMGLAGLAVPERYGGGGASWREVAVVCEELGRAVTPVPYLGSAVVAAAALLAVDDAELLTAPAGGPIVALAVPFASVPGRPVAGFTAEGGTVSGSARGVVDALAADVLLVPTGAGLYAVDATAEGVTR